MSLDKSRIPKRNNSSRKFIPKKQRETMTDPFVDRIKRTRTDKGETVSGRMVETRSQKTSEERKEMLEVEVNTDQAMNDNQEVHGLEGESRNKGLGNALADPDVDNEKTSRQRVKARISTSTRLPRTDRVTPPLVTPLVDNGAALEEALNNTVGSIGEQNEQMSIRMSELERAVHIERENLREEINRNRQEVGRSAENLLR